MCLATYPSLFLVRAVGRYSCGWSIGRSVDRWVGEVIARPTDRPLSTAHVSAAHAFTRRLLACASCSPVVRVSRHGGLSYADIRQATGDALPTTVRQLRLSFLYV